MYKKNFLPFLIILFFCISCSKEIAKKTGGIYFRATDNKKLEEIYAEINKLEKTEIEEFKYYNYDEKYRILVLLALGLILIEWVGRNTLFKSFI